MMEEQNQVNQLPSEPVIQKQSNFLVILLSILLLISCLIAGFFAYQTQKLVKELTEIRNQNLATQIPTSNPTADWKTYTNTNSKISFKYPSQFTLEDRNGYLVLLADSKDSTSSVIDIDIRLENVYADYEKALDFYKEQLINETMEDIGNGIIISGNGQKESEGDFFTVAFIKYKQGAIKIITMKTDTKTLNIVNQILSTFKFTGSEPVACTEDAKLCPDGSSVGRIGPNCEFAPCPN